MTPGEVLRDMAAAAAAQRHYAAAYDHHAERAQIARLERRPLTERVETMAAAKCLRAFRAECRP